MFFQQLLKEFISNAETQVATVMALYYPAVIFVNLY